MMRNLFFITLFVLIGFSCSKKKSVENDHMAGITPVDTQVLHYWKDFDFQKSDFSGQDDQKERIFIEYLQLISQADDSIKTLSINNFLNNAYKENNSSYQYFIALFEKYLYNPNSPIRNEIIFSIVLKNIINNSEINETKKVHYNYQLSMISKNNVGEKAADFEFISKGRKSKLSQIHSEYIILFFNDPECNDCVRVKNILSEINDPDVKILSVFTEKKLIVWQNTVYPDSWINGYNNTTIHKLYDLKAMPTLYLLDENKMVILKDTQIEKILSRLPKSEIQLAN